MSQRVLQNQCVRAFPHDVISVMVVSLTDETAAMLVHQAYPMEFEPFSHVKNFLLFQKICVAAINVSDSNVFLLFR